MITDIFQASVASMCATRVGCRCLHNTCPTRIGHSRAVWF